VPSAPPPDDLDVLGAKTSSASAFTIASLAQKRAARCWPGRPLPAAYARSPSVNSRAARPGPARERPLEALDLQQVQADRHGRRAAAGRATRP
jgi:hypothetical protein